MQTTPLEHAVVRTIAGGNAPRGVELTVRGLDESYAGRSVLSNLDLHLRAGEFVAIVGRSGCGKGSWPRR